MKNIIGLTASLLLLTILTPMVSCQKEDLCEGDEAKQVETFYASEFNAAYCGLQNIDNNKKAINLVIKTQEDYEEYFSCGLQTPEIDFEKYFILAGVYRHHQCARFDSQQVLICNSKIFYKVRMLEQDCQAFTNVFYMAVIEKKYSNLQVKFDVKFLN